MDATKFFGELGAKFIQDYHDNQATTTTTTTQSTVITTVFPMDETKFFGELGPKVVQDYQGSTTTTTTTQTTVIKTVDNSASPPPPPPPTLNRGLLQPPNQDVLRRDDVCKTIFTYAVGGFVATAVFHLFSWLYKRASRPPPPPRHQED